MTTKLEALSKLVCWMYVCLGETIDISQSVVLAAMIWTFSIGSQSFDLQMECPKSAAEGMDLHSRSMIIIHAKDHS